MKLLVSEEGNEKEVKWPHRMAKWVHKKLHGKWCNKWLPVGVSENVYTSIARPARRDRMETVNIDCKGIGRAGSTMASRALNS